MSEMEKAQILHALQRHFDVGSAQLQKLVDQIKDQNIKTNFERIKRGLTVEENYKAIFAAMPWIKNINGLHQEQDKSHKEFYQTPDYSLLVESSSHENFPVFVDVKSVAGQKENCEIMVRQLNNLKNYSRDHGIPLLVAIYWERLGYWTHNCLESFEGRKGNKISWSQAIKNDLSHILGDYTFFVDLPFYRKTTFFKGELKESANHKEYGSFNKIHVGRDLGALKEYDVIDSSIIDAVFKSKEIDKIVEGDSITIIEEIASAPTFLKVSNWLVNFINTWGFEPTVKFEENRLTTIGRMFMVNLMHDLGHNAIYVMPAQKNKGTDIFFNFAYEGTGVMAQYNNLNV